MKVQVIIVACLLIASVAVASTNDADNQPSENFMQLGTCGPATHPAVPVAVIPGAGAGFATIYQFQGLNSGGVYASWFMESNTATNEFEDWGIVFGGYDVESGGYDIGAGETGSTSGSCLYLGSMPTSRWYLDVLGGGGGFTTSNSCTHETWWEAEVGGQVGYEFGSGFELEANGRFAWGGSDSCTNGAGYDSGVLISASSWTINGPCVECIVDSGFTLRSGASAAPMSDGPWSFSDIETPTIDYNHCTLAGVAPVSEKVVDGVGTAWQLWQTYDPLDDTTNVYVLYENAPIDQDLWFGGRLSNANSQSYSYINEYHAAGAAFGCLFAGHALFSYFQFEYLVANGGGDCVAFPIHNIPLGERTKYNGIKIGLRDYDGGPSLDSFFYGESGDCNIDTYSSTVTLDWDGVAALPSDLFEND